MATILALALASDKRPVLNVHFEAMALGAITGGICAQIRVSLDQHWVAFVQILSKRLSALAEDGATPPGCDLAIAALAGGGQAEINHSGSIRRVFALRVAS